MISCMMSIASSLVRMREWATEKNITNMIVNGWLWAKWLCKILNKSFPPWSLALWWNFKPWQRMKVGILKILYIHLFPIPKQLFRKDYFAVYNKHFGKAVFYCRARSYGGPCTSYWKSRVVDRLFSIRSGQEMALWASYVLMCPQALWTFMK